MQFRSLRFVLLTALWITGVVGQNIMACGGTCKPPICGKTITFAISPPADPVLLTDGGVFMMPVVVFAGVTSACTSTSATVTISLDVDCTPGPDATGTLTGAPISLGFNSLTVPVTLPAGPPRACVVTGTATVIFDDGMVLRDNGESVVCISDPAPQNPDVARLSMTLLTPELNCVHPGDQARMCYELVNNDPTNSFSGSLRVGIANASTVPEDLSAPGNGDGVFSVADPVGDTPPIVFEDLLHPGLCVPLPLDPHLQLPNEISRVITLAPGEKREIYVLARHWGLCASGTCAESTAVLEGEFADLTSGLACSGTVVGADADKTPEFLWDGSGRTCNAIPIDPPNGVGRLISQLSDKTPVEIDVLIETIEVNGSEVFNGQDYMAPLDPRELRGQFFLQLPLQPTDPLNGVSIISFIGNEEIQIEMKALDLVSTAPTGFDNIGPFFMGWMSLDKAPFDGVEDGRLSFLLQVSMTGFSGTSFMPAEPVEIFTDGFESGNVVAWSRQPPEAALGDPLDGVQVFFDIRGYVHEEPPTFPCPVDVTADLDGDWLITQLDLFLYGEQFNQAAASPLDRNGDGVVNTQDLVLIVDKLGCQEAGTAPPS